VALLIAMVALAATPTSYRLDPAASALYVRVDKDPGTVASGLAHDHVVVATGWSGTASFGEGGACTVAVEVPVESLVVDDPAFRARVGLEDGPSERQRAQIRDSMLGQDQLAADANPRIAFRADRCDPSGDTVSVHGELTLRGVTRPVVVPMRVSVDGGRMHATGGFTIRATDFGFEPYSAFLGAVKNRDEMRIEADLVGTADTAS
jgi:polyisoprenoid-binding protein YceI